MKDSVESRVNSDGKTRDNEDTKAQSYKVDKNARMLQAYTSMTQSDLSNLKSKNDDKRSSLKANKKNHLKLAKPL